MKVLWQCLMELWCEMAGHDWYSAKDQTGVSTIRCGRCGIPSNHPLVHIQDSDF